MKKKLTALFLALAVTLTFAACGEETDPPAGTPGDSQTTAATTGATAGESAGATTANTAGETTGETAGTTGETTGESQTTAATTAGENTPSSETPELVRWMLENGRYSFDYSMTVESEGQQITSTGTVSADGMNASVTTNTSFMGITMTQRIVVKDNKVYMVDDANRSYMEMTGVDLADAMNGMSTDYSSMTPSGSGTGTVNGRTLPYTEYTMTEGGVTAKVRFYIDGGNVYAMVTETDGQEAVMIITNARNTVSASAFDIPLDYTRTEFDFSMFR